MVWLTWEASQFYHALVWKLFVFFLLVLITSWFVTNHWLWIGWLLGFVANLIDSFFLFFLWVWPCSVDDMLLHINCILTPKRQPMHLSGISQCWWYFLAWDFLISIVFFLMHFGPKYLGCWPCQFWPKFFSQFLGRSPGTPPFSIPSLYNLFLHHLPWNIWKSFFRIIKGVWFPFKEMFVRGEAFLDPGRGNAG